MNLHKGDAEFQRELGAVANSGGPAAQQEGEKRVGTRNIAAAAGRAAAGRAEGMKRMDEIHRERARRLS